MELKPILAAGAALVMISLPLAVWAEDRAIALLEELQNADSAQQAARLERELLTQWEQSGSATMNLLLKRGRDSLEVADYRAAADHFGALTDHAPNFADGWHGLALAYFNLDLMGPALDALERGLALNPHHFPSLRGVGAIHEQLGNPVLAYRAYQKVLDIRPHDADVEEAVKRLETLVQGSAL
jgi:tetratricopeptide (TPR) repeat protein